MSLVALCASMTKVKWHAIDIMRNESRHLLVSKSVSIRHTVQDFSGYRQFCNVTSNLVCGLGIPQILGNS